MNDTIFRTILVATDLTEASDAVLRAAASLAALANAELHVVHACELPMLPYTRTSYDTPSLQESLHEKRRALGEQLARAVGAARGPASQQVVLGSPARVILDRAREIEADLLVLGPHRPRPFGTFGLGTTADRVIRVATAPCLIVRGELSLPLRRVLVPLDLSDPSRGALDLALSWAVRLEDPARASVVPDVEVTVAHVIPLVFDTETFSVDREVLQPELAREIQGAIVRTETATRVSVREEIVWGDLPADEIVRLAEEERTDLVVLATHGHGAVLRALIGSVASHVARRAPCSVLLVPPSRWDADEPSVDAWAQVARAFTPPVPVI